MKYIALIVVSAFIAPSLLANGGPVIYQGEKIRDEIRTRNSSHTRTNQTREKMESNPRNKAMVESFQGVGEKQKEENTEDVKSESH